jgi:hypothetical protein
MHLAQNCIGCIGFAPYRDGTDAVHPNRVGLNHPPFGGLA